MAEQDGMAKSFELECSKGLQQRHATAQCKKSERDHTTVRPAEPASHSPAPLLRMVMAVEFDNTFRVEEHGAPHVFYTHQKLILLLIVYGDASRKMFWFSSMSHTRDCLFEEFYPTHRIPGRIMFFDARPFLNRNQATRNARRKCEGRIILDFR